MVIINKNKEIEKIFISILDKIENDKNLAISLFKSLTNILWFSLINDLLADSEKEDLKLLENKIFISENTKSLLTNYSKFKKQVKKEVNTLLKHFNFKQNERESISKILTNKILKENDNLIKTFIGILLSYYFHVKVEIKKKDEAFEDLIIETKNLKIFCDIKRISSLNPVNTLSQINQAKIEKLKETKNNKLFLLIIIPLDFKDSNTYSQIVKVIYKIKNFINEYLNNLDKELKRLIDKKLILFHLKDAEEEALTIMDLKEDWKLIRWDNE